MDKCIMYSKDTCVIFCRDNVYIFHKGRCLLINKLYLTKMKGRITTYLDKGRITTYLKTKDSMQKCNCQPCRDGNRIIWSKVQSIIKEENIWLLDNLWYNVQHGRINNYLQGEQIIFFSLIGILDLKLGYFTDKSIELFIKRYNECIPLYFDIFDPSNIIKFYNYKCHNDSLYRKRDNDIYMTGLISNYINNTTPAEMLFMIYDKYRAFTYLNNIFDFSISLFRIEESCNLDDLNFYKTVIRYLSPDIFLYGIPDIGIKLIGNNTLMLTDLIFFKFHILGEILSHFKYNTTIYIHKNAKGKDMVNTVKNGFYFWRKLKLDRDTDFGQNLVI